MLYFENTLDTVLQKAFLRLYCFFHIHFVEQLQWELIIPVVQRLFQIQILL